MAEGDKRIVYILRSDADPSRHYVGITNDLSASREAGERGEMPFR
jgi:hypothetical protein